MDQVLQTGRKRLQRGRELLQEGSADRVGLGSDYSPGESASVFFGRRHAYDVGAVWAGILSAKCAWPERRWVQRTRSCGHRGQCRALGNRMGIWYERITP